MFMFLTFFSLISSSTKALNVNYSFFVGIKCLRFFNISIFSFWLILQVKSNKFLLLIQYSVFFKFYFYLDLSHFFISMFSLY